MDNKVAWKLIDGNTMAGDVIGYGLTNRVTVRRVDGTVCNVDKSKVRPATEADVIAAIQFFSRSFQ